MSTRDQRCSASRVELAMAAGFPSAFDLYNGGEGEGVFRDAVGLEACRGKKVGKVALAGRHLAAPVSSGWRHLDLFPSL